MTALRRRLCAAAALASIALAAGAQSTAEQGGAPPAPAPTAAPSPCPPGTTPLVPQPPQGPVVCVQTPPEKGAEAPAQGGQRQPPPAAPRADPKGAQAGPPASTGGGDAESDEEERQRKAAARALERTLVEEGGLVLPPWRVELVPELSYALSEGSALLRTGGEQVNVGTRSEIYTGALTLRAGFPFRFQAEVTAPFVWSRWTGLSGDADAGPETGSGFGDVTAALAFQPLRGHRHLPDVLVSGFWKARNGRSALDDPGVKVPVGTGIEQVGGSLSLLKAVDPVVLLVTGTYAHARPRWAPFGWLDPGDELGASAAAVLAVSPETSLSFGLETGYAQLIRVDGGALPNSDRTNAMFRVGVSTLASRHGMLQVNVGIGLTREVPRFDVTVATPFQF